MADSTGAAPDPTSGVGLSRFDKALLAGQIEDEQAQSAAITAAQDPEDPSTGGINPRNVARFHQAEQAAQQAIGAGYVFTPAQIEKNIADANDLIVGLTHDHQDIEIIIRVTPPAPDPASVAHAKALSTWGQQLRARNQSQINFVNSWIGSLQNAKNAYMSQEHMTAADWTRIASESPA